LKRSEKIAPGRLGWTDQVRHHFAGKRAMLSYAAVAATGLIPRDVANKSKWIVRMADSRQSFEQMGVRQPLRAKLGCRNFGVPA